MLISWLFDFFLIFGFSGRFLAVSCITGFFFLHRIVVSTEEHFASFFGLFSLVSRGGGGGGGEREPFFGKD
jgi:hypothetical protein